MPLRKIALNRYCWKVVRRRDLSSDSPTKTDKIGTVLKLGNLPLVLNTYKLAQQNAEGKDSKPYEPPGRTWTGSAQTQLNLIKKSIQNGGPLAAIFAPLVSLFGKNMTGHLHRLAWRLRNQWFH